MLSRFWVSGFWVSALGSWLLLRCLWLNFRFLKFCHDVGVICVVTMFVLEVFVWHTVGFEV